MKAEGSAQTYAKKVTVQQVNGQSLFSCEVV